MYTIKNHTGRLVEIRIWSPVSLDEAVRWGTDHEDMVSSITGQYVCFVDLIDATVFPQDVVDAYVATMKNEPRLVRTATLLNQSPTLGMQIHRMIREANHPDRKVFRDPEELFPFLAEVLEEPARARLKDLLWDRRPSAPPSARPLR